MRKLALAALLALSASCATLSGVYDVAEQSAPPAAGAGVGGLLGGPAGAVVGAMVGSAVHQAVRGNQRERAQADAVDDLIRGGGAPAATVSYLAQAFQFVKDFTALFVVWTLLCLFVPGVREWVRGLKALVLRRRKSAVKRAR